MLEITTQKIKILNGDLAIDAYLAMPNTEYPVMGVVILQEIFGVNAHIQDITRRLALEGYAAIAPALYQRTAPGFETGYTASDVEIGRKYKDQTTAAQLLADIQATIAILKYM